MPSDRSATRATSSRPLSPHLQIYKPQLTSVLSISHRVTGVALSVGTLLLVAWIAATAKGPDAFAVVSGFMRNPIGLLLLFGWSVSLFYHLANGIRHLFWDAGYGFEIGNAYRSGWVVVGATVVLTVLAWLAGVGMMLGGR
jgi:succinate dehydrogenase / fumarate reductase, cytochrome b subunit